MKETIQTAAESFLPALWAMSRAMYDHPELGLEEVNSSRMLREWLAEQGFKVEENFHGLPTAFRAVYGSGRPVLGFLCEYDALPEVGHGCGHDLIGVVSAGAAAVLRQTVDAVGGTLIVYGTPDEEVTCTKVQLTDEGAFDELDVALMLHPYQKTCGRMGSIGIYPVQYEFSERSAMPTRPGRAATASTPWTPPLPPTSASTRSSSTWTPTSTVSSTAAAPCPTSSPTMPACATTSAVTRSGRPVGRWSASTAVSRGRRTAWGRS